VFAKAEIKEMDVAVIIKEAILGLEVPIKHLLRVQVLHAEENLAEVEHCVSLLEAALLQHVEEELATAAEVEYKEQVRSRLESPVE